MHGSHTTHTGQTACHRARTDGSGANSYRVAADGIDESNGYVIIDLGCSNQMSGERAFRDLCGSVRKTLGQRPVRWQGDTSVRYTFADGKKTGQKADYQANHLLAVGGTTLSTTTQVFEKGNCPYLSSLPQWESMRALIDLNPKGDGQSWIVLRALGGDIRRPLAKDRFGHLRVKVTDLCPDRLVTAVEVPTLPREALGFSDAGGHALVAGVKRGPETRSDPGEVEAAAERLAPEVEQPPRKAARMAPTGTGQVPSDDVLPEGEVIGPTWLGDEDPSAGPSLAEATEGGRWTLRPPATVDISKTTEKAESLARVRQLCSELIGTNRLTVLYGRKLGGGITKAAETQPSAVVAMVQACDAVCPLPVNSWQQMRISQNGNRVAGTVAEAGFLLNLSTKSIRLRPVSTRRGLLGQPTRVQQMTDLMPGEGCSINPRYPIEMPAFYELVVVLYGDQVSTKAMTREEIKKLHLARFHPTADELEKQLRKAGAIFDKAVLEEVTEKCGCQAQPWEKPRRTVLPGLRTQRPCQLVAQDAKKIVHHGHEYWLQNVMDLHTRIQSLFVAANKGERESLRGLQQFMRRYGLPETHLTDNASEYQGMLMMEERQKQGIQYMCTATAAPWQNGILERSNAEVARLHERLHRLHPTLSVQTVIAMIDESLQEHQGPLGYTPFEAMFCRPRRRIGDDIANPTTWFADHTTEYEHRRAAMHDLRLELVRLRDDDDLKQMMKTRLGAQVKEPVRDQSLVWFFLDGVSRSAGKWPKGWYGPARVIGHEGRRTCCLKYGNRLFMVARDYVAPYKGPTVDFMDIPLPEVRGVMVQPAPDYPDTLPGDGPPPLRPEDMKDVEEEIPRPPPAEPNDGELAETMDPATELPGTDDISPEDTNQGQLELEALADPLRSRVNTLAEEAQTFPSGPPPPTTEPQAQPLPTAPDSDDELEGPVGSVPAREREGAQLFRDAETTQPVPWQGGSVASGTRRARLSPELPAKRVLPRDDDDAKRRQERADRAQADAFRHVALCRAYAADGRWQLGRVEWGNITPEERHRFADVIQQAQHSEFQSFLDNKTVRPVQLQPNMRVISTKTVMKWKKRQQLAKCRITLRGFEDRRRDLETEAKTTTANLIRILLHYFVMRLWIPRTSDMRTAFLQGDPFENPEEEGVYWDPPEEMRSYMGLGAKEVLMCLKSIYGLNDAPRRWADKVCRIFLGAGLELHPSVPMLFVRFKGTATQAPAWQQIPLTFCETLDIISFIEGFPDGREPDLVVTTQVDDFLYAGDDLAVKEFEAMCDREFTVGSKEIQNFEYRGMNIQTRKLDDGTIEIDLDVNDYSRTITPIPNIPKTARGVNTQLPLTSQQHTEYRKTVGQLQWAVTQCLVRDSYEVNLLAQWLASPRLQDAMRANRLVTRLASETYIHTLRGWSLKRGIQVVTIEDASFQGNPPDKNGIKSSQGGCLLCVSPREPQVGDPLVLLQWGSHKIKRAHRSAPGAELLTTMAAVNEADLAKWTLGYLYGNKLARETCSLTDSQANIDLVNGIRTPEETNLIPDMLNLRMRIQHGVLWMEKVSGSMNPSDGLTKTQGVQAGSGAQAKRSLEMYTKDFMWLDWYDKEQS